ncbi:YveK family protein [Oceanobacillus halophilus]|uniref:Capsular biosynthesis protein n=1 Tax=Oceanobacillus halophilus TaxID=930130 RepID=A0A495A2J2_9BACI|nr:Wzz/FepE/Etk N-terminal domain-containing protein [Oceanobacillus halophilus]RKQ33507.1 capsular biosynthesis protein [Oceanobacillus halophilus]
MNEEYHRTNIKEIDLKQYFDLLRRRFWIVILITIITTLAGYFYSSDDYVPEYESSRRLIIGSETEDMSTLMVMIKDPIIMQRVGDEVKTTKSPETIANQIDVARIDESQVVEISVMDLDPEMAANIANATADSFKSEIENILGVTDVQLLSEAKVNLNPINAPSNSTTVIALLFGLVVGIGFIFLLDSLDVKIRKESEVESLLDVPILGTISNMKKKKLSTNKSSQLKVRKGEEKVGVKQNA